MTELTKKESKEPVFMTVGRIKGIAKMYKSDRLLSLINKVEKELYKLGVKDF